MARHHQDVELLTRFNPSGSYTSCDEGRRMFLRQVKTVGEGSIWGRFAILPYIVDQKYTFGETYDSSVKEGEFIFFKAFETLEQKKISKRGSRSNICEITCDSNGFFVAPKGFNIWINGVKIQRRRKLRFGDYLSIGVTYGENAEDTNTLWFLFVARELDPEAFLEFETDGKTLKVPAIKNSKSMPSKDVTGCVAMQNVVVVSQILSFLPTEDLKKHRFVCNLWNEEGVKILKQKTIVKFKFQFAGYEKTIDSMRFFRYANEMKSFPVRNLEIKLSRLGTSVYDRFYTSNGTPGCKLLQDLGRFLRLEMRPIQLPLGGEFVTSLDFKVQLQILEKLQANLEQLDWTGVWYVGEEAFGAEFQSTIGFPRLKRFTLSMGAWNDLDDEDSDEEEEALSAPTWLQPLIHAVKGVSALQLDCSAVLARPFLDVLDTFLNLEEMRIIDTEPQPGSLSLLLKNIKNPLKQLELGELDSSIAFEELMVKHAQTLTHLKFKSPRKTSYLAAYMFRDLPVFPNLTHLTVGWEVISEGRGGVMPYKKVQDGNGIDYGETFPRLQSLKIWPSGYEGIFSTDRVIRIKDITKLWEDHEAIYNIFFPPFAPNMKTCKTLQQLVIPTTDTSGRVFPADKQKLLSLLFPNVFNEWINKVRQAGEESILDEPAQQSNKGKVDDDQGEGRTNYHRQSSRVLKFWEM